MFLRYYRDIPTVGFGIIHRNALSDFLKISFFMGNGAPIVRSYTGKKNSATSTIATRLTFDVSILVRSEFSFGGLVRSPEITTAVHRMICTGYTNSIPGTTTVVCGFSPLPWALLCPSTSVVSANRDARGSYVSGCLVHY